MSDNELKAKVVERKVSRLWLIEDVGLDAMGIVNADTFAEAYNDPMSLTKRANEIRRLPGR